MSASEQFTPALGHSALTPLYDAAIALMTREGRWRSVLVRQIAPRAGEHIVDIGCGTGTLALAIKRAAPGATVIGVDPDLDVLERARAKAKRAGLDIKFIQGFARDAAALIGRPADKAVSSLVFHQTPMAEKRAGLGAMHDMLAPKGELHVADYGLQRTVLMRALFSQVQRLDGFENTTPNAEGILPELMRDAGFNDVAERQVIPTPTGSISLYFAHRAGPQEQGR
jgi:ubiquinone/menaquinone biosynthesis C-methylase UbiE